MVRAAGDGALRAVCETCCALVHKVPQHDQGVVPADVRFFELLKRTSCSVPAVTSGGGPSWLFARHDARYMQRNALDRLYTYMPDTIPACDRKLMVLDLEITKIPHLKCEILVENRITVYSLTVSYKTGCIRQIRQNFDSIRIICIIYTTSDIVYYTACQPYS
jgi:hypothetical protein